MKKNLSIQVNMNSSAGDILAFKTCCGLKMQDQNLEFLITNHDSDPATLLSYFDLITPKERLRIQTLIPSGPLKIEPEEVKAFYCQMDEYLFEQGTQVVFFDTQGNDYSVLINQPG